MRLAELKVGATAKVTRVIGESAAATRLLEMGVTPGVKVTVVKTAPLGDPIEVSVRGSHLAIRKSEAEVVEVSE